MVTEQSRFPRLSARKRGYTTKWEIERLKYLKANPLCRYCEAKGLTVEAKVVDHITPHRGPDGQSNYKMFWDRKNWQPLCYPCHNSTKQAEERRDPNKGTTDDGRPRDPKHPWNCPP